MADNTSIWRISLDGLKSRQIVLPSIPKKLTLDYNNHYLHYISVHDNSIYRIDYKLFEKDAPPQKILWLQKSRVMVIPMNLFKLY